MIYNPIRRGQVHAQNPGRIQFAQPMPQGQQPQAHPMQQVQAPQAYNPMERQQLINEMHRRGGAQNAPGFAQKLQMMDAGMRGQRAPVAINPAQANMEASMPTAAAEVTQPDPNMVAQPNVMGQPLQPQPLGRNQQNRQQIINEMHRRGGAANAPGFAQRLQQVDSRIRTKRGPQGMLAVPPEGY